MTHIMVDLETLSTRYNAAIIAIGAVHFSQEAGIIRRYYKVVQTPLPEATEFHVSSDTLLWWTRQSEEARAIFTDPSAIGIEEALASFFDWAVEDIADIKEVKLWGNGAAFDNAILATAYQICNMQKPWEFWNDRCYRTAKSLNRHTVLTRTGTHHNALDDAESQAMHLLGMGLKLA
jgi:hypothetical protein